MEKSSFKYWMPTLQWFPKKKYYNKLVSTRLNKSTSHLIIYNSHIFMHIKFLKFLIALNEMLFFSVHIPELSPSVGYITTFLPSVLKKASNHWHTISTCNVVYTNTGGYLSNSELSSYSFQKILKKSAPKIPIYRVLLNFWLTIPSSTSVKNSIAWLQYNCIKVGLVLILYHFVFLSNRHWQCI